MPGTPVEHLRCSFHLGKPSLWKGSGKEAHAERKLSNFSADIPRSSAVRDYPVIDQSGTTPQCPTRGCWSSCTRESSASSEGKDEHLRTWICFEDQPGKQPQTRKKKKKTSTTVYTKIRAIICVCICYINFHALHELQTHSLLFSPREWGIRSQVILYILLTC